MATLTIRNLDDALVDRLKARAKLNDRSLEAEVRTILAHAARGQLPRGELLALVDRIAERTAKVKQTDSVELVRESREERDRRFDEVEKENRELLRQRSLERK